LHPYRLKPAKDRTKNTKQDTFLENLGNWGKNTKKPYISRVCEYTNLYPKGISPQSGFGGFRSETETSQAVRSGNNTGTKEYPTL